MFILCICKSGRGLIGVCRTKKEAIIKTSKKSVKKILTKSIENRLPFTRPYGQGILETCGGK